MRVGQALKDITERLAQAKVPDAATEAEYFLTHLLSCRRHELYLDSQRQLDVSQSTSIEGFIGRRLKREPVQYITGSVEFHGNEFTVTRDVLIPRPETELLVDEAIKALPPHGGTAVDLCTGSGCIAIAIALSAAKTKLYAIDNSATALKIAADNAARLNVAGRIRFCQGDLFSPLEGLMPEAKADVIVSNPPYVSLADYEGLQPEIRLFEPRSALVAGPDGLEFYRRIIKDAGLYLARGGRLMMEAGYGQAGRIKAIFDADGRYEGFEAIKDLAGILRVVKARVKT